MFEQQIKAGRLVRGMTFSQKVWALTSRVPRGKVTTYGEIARKLNTRAFRAVGGAMHRNPYAPVVPCHRVVGGDGRLTGFGQGLKRKEAMLKSEGVAMTGDKVDLSVFLFRP